MVFLLFLYGIIYGIKQNKKKSRERYSFKIVWCFYNYNYNYSFNLSDCIHERKQTSKRR